MASLVQLELARAWQSYFRQKGGAAPTIPGELLPVVIMDDNTNGPFPPCRTWFAGNTQIAVAAQFSYFIMSNSDSADKKSVVVIDEVRWRTGAADDAVVGITSAGSMGSLGSVQADDSNEDKDQQPTDRPRIGNVMTGMATTATGLGGTVVPNGGLLVATLRGPWTLGPQAVFFLRTATLNMALFAYARGRYYSAV